MLAKKKVRSMQNLNLILSFELFTKFLPRQKVSHAEVHRKIVRLKNVLRKNVRRNVHRKIVRGKNVRRKNVRLPGKWPPITYSLPFF